MCLYKKILHIKNGVIVLWYSNNIKNYMMLRLAQLNGIENKYSSKTINESFNKGISNL